MYETKPYFYGTGRRKNSVARVRVYTGTGKITINGRDIDDYFGLETLKLIVRQPLVVAAAEGARAAGAELVVVKDAHGPGLNILPEELPEFALESCAGAADGPCWCCVAPCCCPFPGCIPPDWLEPVCAVAVETLVEPE